MELNEKQEKWFTKIVHIIYLCNIHLMRSNTSTELFIFNIFNNF
jgi:hypothetical protein